MSIGTTGQIDPDAELEFLTRDGKEQHREIIELRERAVRAEAQLAEALKRLPPTGYHDVDEYYREEPEPTLEEQLAERTAERDSEQRWAQKYHADWITERDRAEALTAERDALAGQAGERDKRIARLDLMLSSAEERMTFYEDERVKLTAALAAPPVGTPPRVLNGEAAVERVRLLEQLYGAVKTFLPYAENQDDQRHPRLLYLDDCFNELAALDGGKESDG